MDKGAMLDAWEQRKTAYANQWKVGLCGAPCKDPGCCCVSLFCPYCTSYALRKRTLRNNMNSYQCCGGFLPCSGRCAENNCPELCLCMEVCCCFGTSVAVTRWMIQDELRIQNSQCDNCLLATMLLLQQLACICQVAACITGDETLAQLADLISFIAEVMWWSVCACLQTQHKVQLDERDLIEGGSASYPTQPPVPQPAPMYPTGAYPTQQGYGAPMQPGYGAPTQPGYGAPTQPGYGYPAQHAMYR